MGHQPGVLTTDGPDPGLTPEERVARAQESRWTRVSAGLRVNLSKVEASMLTASPPKKAALEAKAEAIRSQIEHAESKLLSMVN